MKTDFIEIGIHDTFHMQENFQKVVYKMVDIVSWLQCVDMHQQNYLYLDFQATNLAWDE